MLGSFGPFQFTSSIKSQIISSMVKLTRHLTLLFVAITAFAFLMGCKTSEERMQGDEFYLPRAHIETSPTTPSEWSMDVTMPLSQVRLQVLRGMVFNERNVIGAELVKVDGGLALLLQLDREGTRNLYTTTVQNMGRRLVLTINGAPVGIRLVSSPVNNGVWLTFLEMPDEDLEELVIKLKASIESVQKIIEKE